MNDQTIRRFAACLISAAAMISSNPIAWAAELTNLRCEYRTDPLGIDAEKPRLSWIIQERNRKSGFRGQKQTAYPVLVASSEALLKKNKGDLWDSGKVASDQSIQVEYAGKPLESRMQCHWKVRVWDKDGNASECSQTASWSRVTEFYKPAAQADGVKFLKMEDGAAVYAVGSGTYRFQSTLKS